MKINLKGRHFTREVWINGNKLSPVSSQKVWNHSPDGFSWGYGGSGPAQLALAILLEVCDKEYALKRHQDFKMKYISTLPQDDFEIEIDLKEFDIEIRNCDEKRDSLFSV